MTDETKKDDFQERVLKELAEMRKTMADSTSAKPKVQGGPMSQSSESADDNKEGAEKAKAPAASSSSDEEGVQKYATKEDLASILKAIEALATKPTTPAPEVKKEEKPADPPAPKIEVGEKKGVVPANPLPGINPDTFIDFSSPMWKAGEFDLDGRDRRAMGKLQDLFAKAKGGK